MRRSYFAQFGLSLLCAPPLPAQGSNWTELAPPTSPTARMSVAMCTDIARHRVVLFGGWTGWSGNTYLADTWEWDGTTWLSPGAIPGPVGRASNGIAYDSSRHRVVLFGGYDPGGVLGDTWEWDGTLWLQRISPTSPSARDGLAMAYDSIRQRVVLYGGSVGGVPLGDTWEWDGATWWSCSPPSSPPPRAHSAMAFDPTNAVVVMFGGLGTAGRLADTWAWDGTNWLPQFTPTYPPARASHAMTWDDHAQNIIMFGGATSVAGVGTYLNDTWEWDGSAWHEEFVAGPSPRGDHAMAYDPVLQRTLLFGGTDYNVTLNQTWIAGNYPVVASALPYGAGCGTPPLEFVPLPGSRPILGAVAAATITMNPSSVAAVAIGWSNQFFGPFQLPVTLTGIGMTGCDLLQSADAIGLATTPGSPPDLLFSVMLPVAPAYLSRHVYLQAYCFAPLANPLQLITSNAIDWQFGDL